MDRGLALGFSVLCGSTMGLLILIMGELIGRRIRWQPVVVAIALLPVGLVLLNALMLARGKESPSPTSRRVIAPEFCMPS